MEEKMGAVIGGKKLNRLGSKPGRFKRMVSRHLGKKAAEKIQSSDGARLVAKGKRTGNKQLVKTGGFIRNMFDDVNLDEKRDFEAAITDIDINTRHRNETIEKNGYGPANPDKPGDFWKKKAELWDVSEDIAKSMKCNNCAAFDKSPKTLKKIANAIGPGGDKVVENADLGYCKLFEFKCAGERACDAWVHGGPLTEVTVEGKGLYHNIHMKRKRGEKMRKAGAKGAPKPSDFERAATTAKEEVGFPDDGWGTTKSKKKLKKMTPGEKDMKEAKDPKKMSKLRQLSKSGLVGKKDLNKFDTLMRKVERAGGDMSKLTNQERSFLAGMYDDLITSIINDPSIFNRMRQKGTQKESVQEASNNPQRDHKKAENNERAQLPGAKTQMQKKRILDRIDYHKKMQVRKEDSHADGSYSKKKLKMAAMAATELDGMLGDNDDLPEWVQGKITKACDYLDSARDYMKNMGDDGKAPASEEVELGEPEEKKVKKIVKSLRKSVKGHNNQQKYLQKLLDKDAANEEVDLEEGMYKSSAHARLQKHMNRIRQTSSYKNKVRQLGGTPLKPGEQNPMKRTTEKVDMKKADMGDVIRDFEKSDAPQFKGKSKSKRREMAIAAKLANEQNDLCCDDCNDHFDHVIEESEYKGKKVKLNDPIRTSEVPSKKFKVYVKDPATGNIKVVRFGDPNLSIKRDDPARRKSFRARHNCENPGPKTKARYWSCYQWRASQKVDN